MEAKSRLGRPFLSFGRIATILLSMTFQISPLSVDAGLLAPGDVVDIPITFTDVPADVSGSGTVQIALGAITVDVSVIAVADNPIPVVTSISVEPTLVTQGVTVTVPQIDETGATIRISRA